MTLLHTHLSDDRSQKPRPLHWLGHADATAAAGGAERRGRAAERRAWRQQQHSRAQARMKPDAGTYVPSTTNPHASKLHQPLLDLAIAAVRTSVREGEREVRV
jgi:hypothetical protein